MALVIEHQGIQTGLGEKFSGALRNLSARYAQYRIYRNTVSELSGLSNRELADLGIHRATIKSVAHQAVYEI